MVVTGVTCLYEWSGFTSSNFRLENLIPVRIFLQPFSRLQSRHTVERKIFDLNVFADDPKNANCPVVEPHRFPSAKFWLPVVLHSWIPTKTRSGWEDRLD